MVGVLGHVAPLAHPTPGCAVVARVAFDYGERHFKKDEDFPREKLGLTDQKVQELWQAGLVCVKPAPVVAPQPKRKAG